MKKPVCFLIALCTMLSALSAQKVEVFPQTGHSSTIQSVMFSPDGKTIVSGSWDTTMNVWDVATGCLLRIISGHSNIVYSAMFSPAGEHILSGSGDGTLRIWNTATGKEIAKFISFIGNDDQIIASGRGLSIETETATSMSGWTILLQVSTVTGLFSTIPIWFVPDWQEAPGNRLVFIDACQSGGVDNDRMIRLLMDSNAFVYAASRGNESSLELERLGHGVFTYSILTAIGGDPNAQSQGSVSVISLSGFVSLEVPKLTSDRQHPSAYSLGFHDFNVAETK